MNVTSTTDDGELSSKEFVSVMKTNLMRGLDKVRLPQCYSFLLQCGASFANKYKSISSL